MQAQTEFVNIPVLPNGISHQQFQMFINMPEKLQKKFVGYYQNQQKRSQQLTQEQIDQKLRDAEERKNYSLALKQS